MKRKSKIILFLVLSLFVLVTVAVAVLFKLASSGVVYLPGVPDKTNYATIEKRALAAQQFIRHHHLNEDYCILVDYSIPSGTPRLFVWSYEEGRVVARTYVMHGPGKGSTDERPIFSNVIGSKCSSLGRFIVTKNHGTKLKRSFKLKGLDMSNDNAYRRGLMIHRSTWVDLNMWRKYIPLHEKSCSGCITVSSKGMDDLEKLIGKEDVLLLLWTYE